MKMFKTFFILIGKKHTICPIKLPATLERKITNGLHKLKIVVSVLLSIFGRTVFDLTTTFPTTSSN